MLKVCESVSSRHSMVCKPRVLTICKDRLLALLLAAFLSITGTIFSL